MDWIRFNKILKMFADLVGSIVALNNEMAISISIQHVGFVPCNIKFTSRWVVHYKHPFSNGDSANIIQQPLTCLVRF